MAAADYRLCDSCECKVFYDSELDYKNGPSGYNTAGPYRIAGNPQYEDEQINHKHGTRLGRLGDWAVLCSTCAKSYKTQIVPIAKATGAQP